MQPLVDTAGAGLSFLDTLLYARARDGTVGKTSTRLLLAGRFAAPGAGRAVHDLHAGFFAEAEADASGVVATLPGSFWAFLECSPEGAVGLARRVAAATGGGGLLSSARVVAAVEDAPTRLFPHLMCLAAAPPAESVPDLEAEDPVALCAGVYAGVTGGIGAVAAAAAAGGAAAIEAAVAARLAEGGAGGAPSDERCQALANASKVRNGGRGGREGKGSKE